MAIRIALGVELPRDSAGTWGPMVDESSPAASAVCRTLSRPVSMPSCMNGTFTGLGERLAQADLPQDLLPSLWAATFLFARSQ